MIDDAKLEKLAFMLNECSVHKFTGNVVIKFYKGGVCEVLKEITEKIVLVS